MSSERDIYVYLYRYLPEILVSKPICLRFSMQIKLYANEINQGNSINFYCHGYDIYMSKQKTRKWKF